jgi:hypothetical protein
VQTTLTNWAWNLLNNHPDWQTIRLGHGMDGPWVDIIDIDGHHACTAPDRFPGAPTIGIELGLLVTEAIPLGSWQDFRRHP